MISLRTRLVAVALGVATAGLVGANLEVYRVVRHDLDSRIDRQLLDFSSRRLISRFVEGARVEIPGTAAVTSVAAAPLALPGTTASTVVASSAGSGGTNEVTTRSPAATAPVATAVTVPAGSATPVFGPDGGRGGGGDGSGDPAQQDLPSSRPPRSAFETYAELRDATGRRIAQPIRFSVSDGSPKLLVLPTVLGAPPAKARIFEANDTSGRRHRVAYRRIESGEGMVFAIPTLDRDATLAKLLRVQWLSSAIALFALALLSAILVRLGLRPLRRIEESAATIAGGDLSHRIDDVGSPNTEVGRLQASLNAMLGQIETAFSEKDRSQAQLRRFVADASHELRTPLTSIKGYAELYRRGIAKEGPALDGSMRRIESESTRMTALVEDMLTLARLDQKPTLRTQPVDLPAIVADAVADVRVVDPSRTVLLHTDASPWVMGDPHALMQVVTNLLANARVHTPAGTTVEVRITEEADLAVVSVRDEGPGIEPADQAQLFEPFYRTDPARARASGGAGLGLAIAAGIIEAHGGSIGVTSQPGEGATFTFRLPAIGGEDDETDEDRQRDRDQHDDRHAAADQHAASEQRATAEQHPAEQHPAADDRSAVHLAAGGPR